MQVQDSVRIFYSMTMFAHPEGTRNFRREPGRPGTGKLSSSRRRKAQAWLATLGCVASLSLVSPAAENAPAWSEKDTRLAGEYLNLLVEKPEYGRVLDLLWDLYRKHDATNFLLENISAQVKAQPHPSVRLVQAHLLRKAGKPAEAAGIYDEVLKADPKNPLVLRARADLASEAGDPAMALALVLRLTDLLAPDDMQRIGLLLEQGRLALAVNKPEDAARAWESAARLQPQNTALIRDVAQRLLGTGFLDKALALYQQLAQTSDPEKRLEALLDLARIEEQADHFEPAANALREGLAVLHFKDWRYTQFFLRLVRLHERFGQLDQLKATLTKAAAIKPAQEKALSDMAHFSDLTVDADEHLRWLRELVKTFPDVADYRWQLVSALLDHDQWKEAGELVDAMLKNDGSDVPALVQLRCLAHLRAGEPEMAVARLRQVLDAQGSSLEVEQQVLAFARDKALDEIVERVLRARIARDPDKAEVVFELASYLVKRQRLEDARKVLNEFATAPGIRPQESQQRLQDVAAFLITSQQSEAAEDAARRAVAKGGDRGSLVQLADVLSQKGDHTAALDLLEQAWVLSDTTDRRTDVDEMILSILSGEQVQESQPSLEPSSEFKMPAIFTGEGFGSDAPSAQPVKGVPEAVTTYASGLVLGLGDIHRTAEAARGELPEWAARWLAPLTALLEPRRPKIEPNPEQMYRLAWWCLRSDQHQMAYSILSRLHFDAAGRWQPASVEAERLLLELARTDQNILLALRQLRLLAEMDPDNRFATLLRLAEMEGKRENKRGLDTATSILEGLLKEDPLNETVISMLAPLYLENDQREEAAALWERAAREARGGAAGPLLERYAEVVISQRKFKEFIDVQMRLLETESDVKRRREIFQRAMERLMWADIVQGTLPDDEVKIRLKLLLTALEERSRRAPFDGFWHEALAAVHERQGDPEKAFAEMKQAYYTAPETPFSLEQLRAAALRVGDLKSAIYFQKQIAAAASTKSGAEEWRELVELLEQDFRMGEADQARRRLEARFSQDSAALEELARYYIETGQEDAARRVQEQVARVRSWDVKNLLRLALQQKQMGDEKAAQLSLRQLLSVAPPPEPKKSENVVVEKLPWPLLDGRKGIAGAPANLLTALDNAPGLEQPERDRLRVLLAVPRSEFSEVPDEVTQIRLRSVEELARMKQGQKFSLSTLAPGAVLSDMEKAWAMFYGGDGAGFRAQLAQKSGKADSLESRFLKVWLGLRSHGMQDMLAWARQPGLPEGLQRQRKGLLQAATHLLTEDENFEFALADIKALGGASLFSNIELIDVARKLEGRQKQALSIELRLLALKSDPNPQIGEMINIASLAEQLGRQDQYREYLKMAWNLPLKASQAQPFDQFLQCTNRLLRLAETPQEREHLIRETWRRLDLLPDSGQGILRKALFLGAVGADEASAERMTEYFGSGFLSSQAFVEPMLGGRLPPGAQAPGPRIDEMNHLRQYWDGLREWGDLIRGQGLAEPLVKMERTINERFGGVPLGPKSNYEFGNWRNISLVRALRFATYPERVRMLREFLEVDDSFETLNELGTFLESHGYARECMEVYRRLPARAPANPEYCEQFLRVSENSWECGEAIPFIERLLAAPPLEKPQNLPEGLLEEKHARFLARMQDVARLRMLAFRGAASVKPMQGRVPDEVPYLRELALLLDRMKDRPGALAAWEQLHSLWPQDIQACLRASRLLAEQGNKTRALELLRNIDYTNLWNEPMRESLLLRVKLAADSDQWDEVRLMMNVVTGAMSGKSGSQPHTDSVIAISRELVEHGRGSEAQNLLLRAERATKEVSDRFRLRLLQVQLAAGEAAWSPVRDAARIRSMMLLETQDAESMADLSAFLLKEAQGKRVTQWVQVLKDIPGANLTTAVALSCFAGQLRDTDAEKWLIKPWEHAGLKTAGLQRLTVRTLLAQGKPAWARQVALTGDVRGLADTPVMVEVLAAQKDRHGIDEIFARVTRMSFPGGGDSQDFAETLAKAGYPGLAEELYQMCLERLRAVALNQPGLAESYSQFLIQQHRYEDAENLLMREHQGMTEGLPELILELYRGWNKLDRLPQELAKFHLPDGIVTEILFLRQDSPPPTGTAPSPTPPPS